METWWEERSLGEKIGLGILFGILGIGFMFAVGWVLMLLWNWLMPDIFGLPEITYWKAWGLLLLSCILFKDCNFGDGDHHKDRKRRKELRRYMEDEPTTEGPTEDPPVS